MSYATGTTHYNLPLTVGTDKRDWADTNQAFSNLDSAVYGAVSDVATAGTAIEGLETRMTTAEGNISDNAANITSLDTRMTTAEGAITSLGSRVDDVGNDLGDMICAYNEPTATSTHPYDIGDYFRYNDVLYRTTQSIAIGDTIVPDTNCTTTNISSELIQIIDDIPDVSGLTADITQLQTDVSDLKSRLLNNVSDSGISLLSDALRTVTRWIIENVSESDYHRIFFILDTTVFRISRISATNIGFTGTRTLVGSDEIQLISNEMDKSTFSQRAFVIKFNLSSGTTFYVFANDEGYTPVGGIPVYID